ncbi:MAG: SulP family inorganic anion transporter [Bacteriovoracia bacterium]
MVLKRFFQFLNIFDNRFEDLNKKNWKLTVYRDFSAGLIVAMTAIPMAMGFAIASGLRPEQGIIAGALACLIGRTFGGSKYQVYGPTAAFIPLIYSIMQNYEHSFLVLVSIVAGIILMIMGLAGLGKIVKLVPESIVVGFTVGIGISIAMANVGDAFGYRSEIQGNLFEKLTAIGNSLDEFNIYALILALLTFVITKVLLKISIFIPAPIIAIGTTTLLSLTAFSQANITYVRDKFGTIPHDFFIFTPPSFPTITPQVLFDILYYVVAIVFISAIESLLCSSMADKLAENKKTPFNPDKEFWGQGLVQILTPLVNGFPCTGALARTATSIKAGAVTPLAGYFKGILKLVMAYFVAQYLEHIPMACIAGILIWVATNMVNITEVRRVAAHGRFHLLLMVYTAVMVPMTDFLSGVLSALMLYGVTMFFNKNLTKHKHRVKI